MLTIMHVVLNCSLRVGYSYFPALTALHFHRLGCIVNLPAAAGKRRQRTNIYFPHQTGARSRTAP